MDDFLQLFSEITLLTPSVGAIVAGVMACLLLFVSGFASGSEIAFFSLTPNDLSELDEEKSNADAKIMQLRAESERTLATILIANNLVNVTIIMLFGYFFAHAINFGDSWWLEFLFMTVLLTFLLLLFGEIMPKVYATKNPLQFCRAAVGGICFFRKLFYPVASIVVSSGRLTERVVQKENQTLSVDELEQALELTDTEDIKEEKRMLEGIVRFGDETVKEVMTSRQDVVDLDFKAPYEDVLKCVVDNNYSRIPVYQDNQDNIRGILYIKDLLPYLSKGNKFNWQSLIRPPYFVPETKKIDDLLREFQENKVHIAIVVDEFGGTSGIVTLEDILEEIVGEINDEYDEDEKSFVRINSNTFVFEGKTLLSDFYRLLKLDDETFAEVEGEADTLAGLLLEIKGDFPKLHEKLDYQNFTFEILEMDERRISKVKVVVHDHEM
ncbi:MAG: gliding motility-associated protein GldE [Prevotella sp.]|nr:gliding motility-associated protein GldE [Prevotella sp.]MBQ6405437.1 gliding motility-associated protein GldE [Prevotella sp.]